MFRIRDRSRMG